MFLGTQDGSIYTLDYMKMAVMGVFKVHSESVNVISVTSSYLITGSDDHKLKIWPKNIEAPFFTQDLASPVTQMHVRDHEIACGTKNGDLVLFNLLLENQIQLLRSHSS